MDSTRRARAGPLAALLASLDPITMAAAQPAAGLQPMEASAVPAVHGPRALRFSNPALKAAFARAWEEAARRLSLPGCRMVLSDFTDPDGLTLQERLERTRTDAVGYFSALHFADGEASPGCHAGALAHTYRGSSRVVLCKRFVKLAWTDPEGAAHVLIHELLHALGLGEDPPSSLEITRGVARRCSQVSLN